MSQMIILGNNNWLNTFDIPDRLSPISYAKHEIPFKEF